MNDQERRARAAIRRAASTIMAVATLSLGIFVLPASAQQLNVICPVQAEWCNLAATEFEKETGIKDRRDAQRIGRVVCADCGRESQPEARRVVRRHRRSASAGGRTGIARGIQVADARLSCSRGRRSRRSNRSTARSACTSACSASATTPSCWRRKSWRRPPAGATWSSPNSPATCRWRTRMRRAPRTRQSRRSCR